MQLDDLIAQVEGEDPLDRLSSAMSVKADLDDLSDSLIGHFVDQARRAGCSWSEIGAAMGVTKQAAQQRHTSERPPWQTGQWTGRAKNVVREANGAAAEMGYSYVGTEHLLLGMLAIPQGIAGRLLAGAGVTRDDVVAQLLPPDTVGSGRRRNVPHTPRATEALRSALQNGLRLGHNYIGTEHLLLGLFDVPEGLGAKIIIGKGMTKASVESEVIEILKQAS